MEKIGDNTKKLFKALGFPTEDEIKQMVMMRQNSHPLVLRIMDEEDVFVREALMKSINEKSDEARVKIIEMILELPKPINHLKAITEEILRKFGNVDAAIKFATLHMNEIKENLILIFNRAKVDSPKILEYLQGIETFQATSLVNDFLTVIPDVVEEADIKISTFEKPNEDQRILRKRK